MLYGIHSDSSLAVGEMIKGFTTRTFDMKTGELTSYCQQALALSTTELFFGLLIFHNFSSELITIIQNIFHFNKGRHIPPVEFNSLPAQTHTRCNACIMLSVIGGF